MTSFFFLCTFLVTQRFLFRNFLLCCPSKRSARSHVPSQVTTHQEISRQLWAGETPDSNPGLQYNSLARYQDNSLARYQSVWRATNSMARYQQSSALPTVWRATNSLARYQQSGTLPAVWRATSSLARYQQSGTLPTVPDTASYIRG